MKRAALAIALWLLSSLILPAQSYVLLETGADGKTTSAGDLRLLQGSYSPASTFKMLIAWAAFQQGIATPATRHLCPDQGGKEISLAEAMYLSSNDYFRWLGLQLDREKFDALIRESGWGGPEIKPMTWLAAGNEGVERGGNLRVTVEQMHALSRHLVGLKPDAVSENLKTAMRRPWNDSQSRVYGKSGAWGGAVWMTGYYDAAKPEERKVVTVFVPYVAPDWKPARERAQVEFYRALGLPRPAN